ncbi:ABC transporter permease [Actinomadura nitritigenes]|uniref:ABC transporter permease n=1 Tax=Actinomadura nitritigenes TaxID=134602 RepID=UPI003D89B27C
MGRTLIVARLALRDLRRRPGQALLLVIAVAAAATTLTLGLLVRDAAGAPWQRTRAAAGPDAVATVPRAADLAALARADGVAEAGRPQPTLSAPLRTRDTRVNAVIQGRDPAPSGLDRPYVTTGRWLSPGTAVVERAFADALHVRPGDRIVLAGRAFRVAGIAVTAARAPYPSAAQLLPAAVAAVAGVPLGLLVHRAALALGGGGAGAGVPPAWLAAVVPAALAAVAVLTAVPVRRAATRPVARVLSG